MFCGGDQDAFFLQAGGVANAGHIAANCLNLKPIEVTTTKNDAGSGSGRKYPEGYRCPAVEPYALAFYWGPNCLFKWQVIPKKQITPDRVSAYVVFLPHKSGLCPQSAPWQNRTTTFL